MGERGESRRGEIGNLPLLCVNKVEKNHSFILLDNFIQMVLYVLRSFNLQEPVVHQCSFLNSPYTTVQSLGNYLVSWFNSLRMRTGMIFFVCLPFPYVCC